MLTSIDLSSGIYYYHFDATGNTVALTNEGGNIVNSYAYSPFGIIANEQEAVLHQPFKYVGQYGVMSEPNGLYYMRARFYDPYTGRFISQDPLGFEGGDINLYVYAANNPIMYADPEGQFAFIPVAAGFMAAEAIAIGTAYLGTKIAQWAANRAGADIENAEINRVFKTVAAVNVAEVGTLAGLAGGAKAYTTAMVAAGTPIGQRAISSFLNWVPRMPAAVEKAGAIISSVSITSSSSRASSRGGSGK